MSWEMVEKFIAEYREAWEHATHSMSALQSALKELSSAEAERKQKEQCLLSPPMRRVTLDFEIDERPVTFEDYKEITGYIRKYHPLHKDIHADSHGFVRGVTWFEADEYARFLGKRLPSEQEWIASQVDWYNMLEWTSSNEGDRKVLRGGSWDSHAIGLRTADRFTYSPGSRYDYGGFRCARDVK